MNQPGEKTSVQPSKDLVLETAQTPHVRLGERFHAFQLRYSSGSLGRVLPEEVTTKQLLTGMWPYILIGIIVLLAAITVEVIYGSKAAMLLSGVKGRVPLSAAIAATLLFNGGAWFLTDLAYRRNPHLAHHRGLLLAVVCFVAIVIPVIILGLVIGGWDAVPSVTSSGGDRAGVDQPTTDVDHDVLLALAYITLVILATIVTAAGHYLLLDTYHERRINLIKENEKAAKEASLSPPQQQETAKRLAQAYLDTITIAHHHAETRIKAYNSAFAHRVGPELNGKVDPLVYTPPVPDWKPQAEALVGVRNTGASL